MAGLVLIRHSTPAIDGLLPPESWRLSAEGATRATALAEEIRELRPGVVFTSPERKAHETADRIVTALGLAPARITPDLREHDAGGAPFTDEASFRRSVQGLFARPTERVFGAETADEAHARFRRAIAALPASVPGASTVVVSHGRVLALFIARQRGVDPFELWRTLTTPWFTVLELD